MSDAVPWTRTTTSDGLVVKTKGRTGGCFTTVGGRDASGRRPGRASRCTPLPWAGTLVGRALPQFDTDGTQSSRSLMVVIVSGPNWLFTKTFRRTCLGCPFAPFIW